MLSISEYALWNKALDIFRQGQLSFANQVALVHSFVMNSAVPMNQLTIESEEVAVRFLVYLLNDHNSLTYYIFSHANVLTEFLKKFSGISTGWNSKTVPFIAIDRTGKMPRFVDYIGSLSPQTLVELLKERIIFPKGVLKFFLFMVEGGLLSIGGMCQREYCTEIKDRAVQFLHAVGEKTRANILNDMPTQIATITPCWGLQSDGRLADVLDCIEKPISVEQMKNIVSMSGEKALKNSAQILYPFFTGRSMPVK